ncbi:MAG: cytochrome c [Deltaproteobacteria bacterium]|nr:cytochrome c [Deltaproteobacteria bacterium]
MKRKTLLSVLPAIVLWVGGSATTAGDPGLMKEGTKRSITLPAITVTLKDAPGKEVTGRFCGLCHSLDYITTQHKFPKARWQAEAIKMVKVYGAAIPDEDARIIADYISKSYGTGV